MRWLSRRIRVLKWGMRNCMRYPFLRYPRWGNVRRTRGDSPDRGNVCKADKRVSCLRRRSRFRRGSCRFCDRRLLSIWSDNPPSTSLALVATSLRKGRLGCVSFPRWFCTKMPWFFYVENTITSTIVLKSTSIYVKIKVPTINSWIQDECIIYAF